MSAISKSARMTMFSDHTFGGGLSPFKPLCFTLLRPSKEIEPVNLLATIAGVDSSEIDAIIPEQDLEFLITYHEIGHMDYFQRGIMNNRYASELYADRFALSGYLNRAGDPEVVRNFINHRALGGFLRSSRNYWIAPSLSSFVFNDADDLDEHAAIAAHTELRLRVYDMVAYEGNLERVPSSMLRAEWLHHEELAIQGEQFDFYSGSYFSRVFNVHQQYQPIDYFDDRARLFDAVDRVAKNMNVHQHTRQLGEMVLCGAQHFMKSTIERAQINLDSGNGSGSIKSGVSLAFERGTGHNAVIDPYLKPQTKSSVCIGLHRSEWRSVPFVTPSDVNDATASLET